MNLQRRIREKNNSPPSTFTKTEFGKCRQLLHKVFGKPREATKGRSQQLLTGAPSSFLTGKGHKCVKTDNHSNTSTWEKLEKMEKQQSTRKGTKTINLQHMNINEYKGKTPTLLIKSFMRRERKTRKLFASYLTQRLRGTSGNRRC